MKARTGRMGLVATAVLCILLVGAVGCGSKEDNKAQEAKPVIAPAPVLVGPPEAQPEAPKAPPAVSPKQNAAAKSPAASAMAVEIDGTGMSRSQLDSEVKKRLESLKGKIPPESLERARTEIRQSVVDEFIVRHLLTKEIAAQKLTATEKEVAEVLESVKAQLPAGVTMDDLLKKNNLDLASMREEIGMNIRINKLVMKELGGKVTVSEKEVSDFFNKNREQFKQPESVHARHVLIAKSAADTDKVKAEKRIKAEEVRKQLLAGADFAEMAKKHSDCPSKQGGGDLGTFTRGQMVKPFEDAAFSQAKQVIGPVVETEFGFHIIQVIDRQAARAGKLDDDAKRQISAVLERQKQQGAFDAMIKRLKAGAKIVVHGQ